MSESINSLNSQIFVQTAFLGDLILSIPMLVQMKRIWPKDKLVLVARKGVGAFLKDLDLVDELIEVEKGNSKSYQQAIQSISQEQVNRVISPHESLRTTLFVHKIKAPYKVSFKNFWSLFFYTHTITKKQNLPEVLRQLDLLSLDDEALGQKIKNEPSQHFIEKKSNGLLPEPPDWAFISLKEKVQNYFKFNHSSQLQSLVAKLNLDRDFLLDSLESTKYFVLFPGSTWETKKWTESGFVELGNFLSVKYPDHFVLLMGSGTENELCERVKQKIKNSLNIAGKTSILETLYLLSNARMMIGNDSASAHMASIVEAPTLTFFGPTVLSQGFRPWGKKSYILENEKLNCRPCGKHGHKKCPLGTHECMKSIEWKEFNDW